MQPGDIVQRYRKPNFRCADFYVILGREKHRPCNVKMLGFYKDGTPTTLHTVYEARLQEMYRVVGHTEFVLHITHEIKLITETKE